MTDAGRRAPTTETYVVSDRSRGSALVRNPLDVRIAMRCVLVAAVPCVLMALYNTGYQANLALAGGADPVGWRSEFVALLGQGHAPTRVIGCLLFGALFFVPILAAAWFAAGLSEEVFARARGRTPDHAALLVIALLFALAVPASLPLWKAALGCAIGIVIGKEIFGGFGHNFVNPVVVGLAFLYFAYPGAMTGAGIWVPVPGGDAPTALAIVSQSGLEGLTSAGNTWSSLALGRVPGAMGATSDLACLVGLALMVYFGVASWRIVAAGCLGLLLGTWGLSGAEHPLAELPWHWHLVIGSFSFGMVFLATDPVTSATTNPGRWLYGGLIGVFVALVRIANPSHQEGILLAILLGNVSAPLLDRAAALVQYHIRRAAHAG